MERIAFLQQTRKFLEVVSVTTLGVISETGFQSPSFILEAAPSERSQFSCVRTVISMWVLENAVFHLWEMSACFNTLRSNKHRSKIHSSKVNKDMLVSSYCFILVYRVGQSQNMQIISNRYRTSGFSRAAPPCRPCPLHQGTQGHVARQKHGGCDDHCDCSSRFQPDAREILILINLSKMVTIREHAQVGIILKFIV